MDLSAMPVPPDMAETAMPREFSIRYAFNFHALSSLLDLPSSILHSVSFLLPFDSPHLRGSA
jgi:hypothetical protein